MLLPGSPELLAFAAHDPRHQTGSTPTTRDIPTTQALSLVPPPGSQGPQPKATGPALTRLPSGRRWKAKSLKTELRFMDTVMLTQPRLMQ